MTASLTGPDPRQRHPIPGATSLVFLRRVVIDPWIGVADDTCHRDFDDRTGFVRNVRHRFPFAHDRRRIGRCRSIAAAVTFLVNGGSHTLDGVSTCPSGGLGQGRAGHGR